MRNETVGWVIFMFLYMLVAVLFVSVESYKIGQIDAMNGKFKYELMKTNSDSIKTLPECFNGVDTNINYVSFINVRFKHITSIDTTINYRRGFKNE